VAYNDRRGPGSEAVLPAINTTSHQALTRRSYRATSRPVVYLCCNCLARPSALLCWILSAKLRSDAATRRPQLTAPVDSSSPATAKPVPLRPLPDPTERGRHGRGLHQVAHRSAEPGRGPYSCPWREAIFYLRCSHSQEEAAASSPADRPTACLLTPDN
jgi:hypothetical protein